MNTFTNKKPSSLESIENAMLKQVAPVSEPAQVEPEAQVEPSANPDPNPQTEPVQEPVAQPNEPVEPAEPNEPAEPVAAEPNEPAIEAVIDDWDEKPEAIQTESEAIKKAKLELLKELGIEDISQEKPLSEQIIEKYKPQQEDVLANVPDNLKKAIELANKGIDYEQYLNINKVDYDAISDADLYASAVVDFFRNEDGSVNEDALQDHIDSYSDSQLKVEAHKVRRDLKNQQSALNKMLESNAQAAREEMVQKVDQSLSSFKSVHNFKVNDYQKNKIKEAIVKNNGSLEKDLFYTNGKPDYAKMVDVKFKVDNFDKIVSYLQTQNRNEGKRQVISNLSNTQLPSNGEPVLQGAPTQRKSGQALLLDEIRAKYQQ